MNHRTKFHLGKNLCFEIDSRRNGGDILHAMPAQFLLVHFRVTDAMIDRVGHVKEALPGAGIVFEMREIRYFDRADAAPPRRPAPLRRQ